MNIKAERIEQMIQIINRNLLLIFSGQQHGVVPMDIKQLQRVDTVIFGHDKFAFEMVHFVKSASQNMKNDGQIFSIWEQSFVTSLETLLVECAVVNDDIERDCFVSRVYCWFTEKLSERRELPRSVVNGVGDIQSSLRKLNVNSQHTTRGLASYNPANSPDASLRLRSHPASTTGFGPQQTLDNGNDANDRDFPTISVPEKSKFGARKVPVYIKQGFPTVLQSNFEGQQSSFLPKIPGAEENYGMVYNVPETEAERTMHELWMARRRQEAFEWKTQQHLSLVMDRISLHKSRLESESLRRQESGTLLKLNRNRPASASDITFGRAGSPDRSPTRPSTERARHRDAGRTSPRRTPQHTLNGRSSHLHPHAVSHNVSDTEDNLSSHPRDPHRFGEGTTVAEQNTSTTNVVLSQNGWESEAHIAKPSRISVARQKKEHLPMKFKMDLPDAFNVETTQQFYMQLSDSDDDDKPDRPVKPTAKGIFLGASTSQKQGKKKPGTAAGKPVEAQFKHERPIVRERPVSARLFRTVATADPEFKVHYRHTNYRRMPLTEQQEQWLDEREASRSKKSQDLAHKLVADVQAKADKKKDKGKKDGDAKKKKDAKDKKGAVVVEEKPKPKYSTASQFMSSNFPNFEGDDDPQSMGPMRAMQLVEVARVMGCFDEYGVGVKESALRKALIIPQDRSEAICLENLRETASEGLMLNPLPREYWRAFTMKKGGKKKKKSKK